LKRLKRYGGEESRPANRLERISIRKRHGSRVWGHSERIENKRERKTLGRAKPEYVTSDFRVKNRFEERKTTGRKG